MNRSVMAARAAQNGLTQPRRNRGTTGTDPSARPSTVIQHCEGPVRRSTAMKMTGAQRNSEGRRSEWSASPEFFTDPKWSQTVSSQR